MSELLKEETPVRERFEVDNDMKAEWVLSKIRRIRADQKKETDELQRQMQFYKDQMDMIDKQADSRTLSNLGATPEMLRRIFLYEGWLISALGAAAGLIIGLIICLIQEHFGLLKLGNGNDYVLSAYPVEVQAPDILLVALIVLAIGYLSAYIPTRQIVKKS